MCSVPRFWERYMPVYRRRSMKRQDWRRRWCWMPSKSAESIIWIIFGWERPRWWINWNISSTRRLFILCWRRRSVLRMEISFRQPVQPCPMKSMNLFISGRNQHGGRLWTDRIYGYGIMYFAGWLWYRFGKVGIAGTGSEDRRDNEILLRGKEITAQRIL